MKIDFTRFFGKNDSDRGATQDYVESIIRFFRVQELQTEAIILDNTSYILPLFQTKDFAEVMMNSYKRLRLYASGDSRKVRDLSSKLRRFDSGLLLELFVCPDRTRSLLITENSLRGHPVIAEVHAQKGGINNALTYLLNQESSTNAWQYFLEQEKLSRRIYPSS